MLKLCISFLKIGITKYLEMHRPVLDLDWFFVIRLTVLVIQKKKARPFQIKHENIICTNLIIHNSLLTLLSIVC